MHRLEQQQFSLKPELFSLVVEQQAYFETDWRKCRPTLERIPIRV
jgi:hypothetical protein